MCHLMEDLNPEETASKRLSQARKVRSPWAQLDETHTITFARDYRLPEEICRKFCRTFRMSIQPSPIPRSIYQRMEMQPRQRTTVAVASRAAQIPSTTYSPFLNLPAELRNWIYEALLLEPEPITVARPPLFKDWTAHPLLHTCRQIRNEGSQIYFSSNIFVPYRVAEIDFMVAWLKMIGFQQYRMLRKIYLDDRYHLRESKAKMTIRAYSTSLVYAGIHIAQKAFYIHAFVDGLRDPIWLSVPDMVFLRTNERG